MKKLLLAIVCLLLLLLGGAAVWWLFCTGDKARDVVPADATAALVFHPFEFIREIGLTPGDIGQLASSGGKRWSHAVNLTKPVYAFAQEDGMCGVAVNVKDAGILLGLLHSYGFASEEAQGLHWVTNGSTIGCIDSDKMLVSAAPSAMRQDSLRSRMARLMAQGSHDVPLMQNMQGQKGALKFCSTLACLPEALSSTLPDGTDASEAYLNAALRAEGRNVTLTASVQPTLSLPLAPICGDLAGMQPAEPFLWLCCGMKGEQLLGLLRDMPKVRMALLGLNMIIDADMIIKAIDGDVTLAIPRADAGSTDFLLTATLAGTDFLRNADEWQGRASVRLGKRGPADYVLRADDYDTEAYFGVRDGRLYVASSAEMADIAMKRAGENALQETANGKYLCGSVDIGQLLGAYPDALDVLQALPCLRETADALQRITLSSESPGSVELKLETDKPIKDIFLNTWKLVAGRNE